MKSDGDQRGLLEPIGDATAGRIVRAEFELHAVTWKDADAELAHLPRRLRQHRLAVLKLDAVHGVRQDLPNDAFCFDELFFFCHSLSLFRQWRDRPRRRISRAGRGLRIPCPRKHTTRTLNRLDASLPGSRGIRARPAGAAYFAGIFWPLNSRSVDRVFITPDIRALALPPLPESVPWKPTEMRVVPCADMTTLRS